MRRGRQLLDFLDPDIVARLRGLELRARDLAPIESRPGRWIVTDPSGEVLMEEKAPSGKWGVVAGSFPLAAARVASVAAPAGNGRDAAETAAVP